MIPRLIEATRLGDRRALSQLLTLVERGGPEALEAMGMIHSYVGQSYSVGITGPPGAGKSTLVDALTKALRDDSHSVGILAADPTSPFTGGAVLGDRIRLQRHYLDPAVFIRSMASRGSQGGLPHGIQRVIRVLDAASYPYVMVETVGVGQVELDIVGVTDTIILVLTPEAGDSVQTMKAGLLEAADILVINKADRPGAGQLETSLRAMLTLGPRDQAWRPPVILTEAVTWQGIEELYKAIHKHRSSLERTGGLVSRRRRRRAQEFLGVVREEIGAWLEECATRDKKAFQLFSAVEEGDTDPYVAAKETIERAALFKSFPF